MNEEPDDFLHWAERRMARDGRICNCEDAPCCGHYDG